MVSGLPSVKYLFVFGLTSGLARLVAQVSPSSDPFQTFTSFGLGGVLAGVVYLWQRDTAKQRDQAMKLLTDLNDAINGIKPAIDKSTEAHEKGSEAAKEMLDVVKGMPPRETWVRVIDALERGDVRRRGTS